MGDDAVKGLSFGGALSSKSAREATKKAVDPLSTSKTMAPAASLVSSNKALTGVATPKRSLLR